MKVEHEIERKSHRKVADRILTIRIEPDNHAIVLNVSDEGLGFHAYAPVQQSGIMHFSFSDNGQRFEGSGELIWTDATQKTGGLRFSSLSRAGRQRIWNWLDQLGAVAEPGAPVRPATTNDESDLCAPAPSSGMRHPDPERFNKPIAPKQEISPRNRRLAQQSIAGAGRSADAPERQTAERSYLGLGVPQDYGVPQAETPVAAPAPQPATYSGFSLIKEDPHPTPYSWDQQFEPKSETKFFSGFVTGGILSAIVAAIVIFAYGNPVNYLISQAKTAPPASPSEPAPPPPSRALTRTPVPSPADSSGSMGAPTAPSPAPDVGNSASSASNDTAASSDTAPSEDTAPTKQPAETERPATSGSRLHLNPARVTRPPKAVVDSGDEDFALAQRYLSGRTGRADSTFAAPFLWAAVQKGNVNAEITLADLYARGDGVTKNCDQARVLLRAAAEKGSSEASQELSQIIRRGCR